MDLVLNDNLQNMINPFKTIDDRLSNIECILLDLKRSKKSSIPSKIKEKIIPVKVVISGENKLMSPPTFYKWVKEGRITLLKFGGRSYVNQDDFYKSFTRIKEGKGNG
jgi:hypothetical protein